MSEVYLTKDTGEAAYIFGSGVKLNGLITSDDGDYVFFSFSNPVLCREMKNEYFMGMGSIAPRTIMKAYKYLLRRVKENSMKTRS